MNTREDVPTETRGDIIDSFLNQLILSGYSLQASRRIVVSGLRGYERIRKLAAKTGGFINRPARVGKEGRRLKKLLGKSNWFKKEAKKQQEEKIKGRKQNRIKLLHHLLLGSLQFFSCPRPEAVSCRGGSREQRRGSLPWGQDG